ncbi:MAG TPA: FtsX-like permease family protein, partial [Terriglobia bacterium]|nr:FtsX-like permease family protein [Terriglobia bacterium]
WGEPEAAIGKRIRGPTDAPGLWRKIIGVTQDVHNEGLYHAPPPIVYWPAEPEFELRAVSYVIRSDRAGTESFVNEVRRAVSAINPDLPVFQVRTLQEIYSGSLARTAFMLVLLTIAGAMALLLSVVGIYGSISYIVSQRSREIGIRLALGAEPRAVKRMFLRQGLFLTAVGLAIGLGAAIALTRLMSSLLFAVSPLDPVTFAAAAAGLIVAALVASYLPSRRATKVDPMDSLRAE